jgi:uncharacterized membrane protein YhhN
MNRRIPAGYLPYLLAVLLDLFLVHTDPSLRLYSKPLLMPLLMAAYVSEVGFRGRYQRLLLAALSLSWLGDVLLMFDGRSSGFFIGGLTSFLSAHVAYIAYFLGIHSDRTSYLKTRPVMLLVVVVFVIELLYILWPRLGGMRLPVTVYGIVIGTMLACAWWQYGRLENRTAWSFIAGAMFFVISDSLLAINRFAHPTPAGGLLVMATYCMAQYMLARGSVRHLTDPVPNTF